MISFSSVPVLVSLLFYGASSANVSCAEEGKAYNDSSITVPSYLADAAACQAQCAAEPKCKVFTYYSNKQACWTQTENATLLDLPNASLAAFAISGPKICPGSQVDTSESVVATDDDSSSVSESAADGSKSVVATDDDSSSVSESAADGSTDKLEDSTKPEGAFPPWVWLVGGAVLLIGVGGAGMYYISDPKHEQDTKNMLNDASTTRGVALESADAPASTQATPAGLPRMVPVPTISLPVPQGAPVQQPVQYVSGPLSPMAPQVLMPMQYMPVQQGYEYEMPNQPRPSTASSMQQMPVYRLSQGYEQV